MTKIVLNPETLIEEGIKASYKSDKSQAINFLKKAIELDPMSVKAWYYLGRIYSELRNHKESVRCFEKLIKLEQTALNYYNLATEYYNAKFYREAIETYKEALAINSDYVLAYDGLGNAYGNLEDYENAILYYRKAIELDQNDVILYSHLGWALGCNG